MLQVFKHVCKLNISFVVKGYVALFDMEKR